MNLREWKSSLTEVNKVFKEDGMKRSQRKVLRLNKNSAKDKRTTRTKSFKNLELATSKRQGLEQIASIFDPLGYLIPVTMKMHLFLKQLLDQNKDWDDTMEEEDLKTFENWSSWLF